jgi:hypothetical protein
MKTISHSDLPNADLSTVGIVPIESIFPIETYYEAKIPAYIHNDGSMCRFFIVHRIDIASITEAIKAMEYGTSMQIYRYHEPKNEHYFISIRKEIDYKNSTPSSIFKEFNFNPVKIQFKAMSSLMNMAYDSISRVASKMETKETDYLSSDLPHILVDFELKSNIIHSIPIRTNLSYLKLGQSRFGTMASLNNMTVIPQTRKCLSDHTFLQRIVLINPSMKRRGLLQVGTIDNAKLIEALTEKKHSPKKNEFSVDTLVHNVSEILPRGGRIFYADVTWLLFSDSMESLNEKMGKFYSCMEKNNVALYCHTNTTRASYISMFPGNDPYGERYTLLFEHFMHMLIWKALEL